MKNNGTFGYTGMFKNETGGVKMKLMVIFSVVAALVMTGCSMKNRTDNIPAVTGFDLPRYMGKWYEIARYPHWFEKGLSHVSATYSLLPDGKVQVVNKGILPDGKLRLIKGVAVACPPAGSGELKVSFFRPFYGAYRIVYLSPEYDFAIVTSSTKDYLWLLSRKKEINAEQKDFFLNWIREHGFSSVPLIWVEQSGESAKQ